ncbi:hypothetical protein Glove_478g44 [Diversispora epigaea]|uniref:BTB domain-containing protein n=1 Tax=Diversispora epigaea TaxID=1348612 RepID=A0A397GKD3_9GLOM|nr:hypothetical protein Glove_478g44 [Diversispora epigaea]
MTTQFYDRLSKDFTQLLESGVNCDVCIEVGEEEIPLANIYNVHSIILQSRSPYFKKKFDEIIFNEKYVKVLKLPNISVKVFNVIIKYIYSGKISLEKLENSVIFDLLIASNELELDELIEHLQTNFVNNIASWLILNFAQVYRISYQVKSFKIIRNFCDDIIAKYPNTIFESENFNSLPEDILISILMRDDLQLEEGKIWEYIVQWGKAKNPNLPTSLNEWTSVNFATLKETLKGCLPHIRYFSISGEDIVEKVYPYQQILEHQLFSDITIKFITPNKPISSIVLPPRRILNTTLPTRITPISLSSNIITNENALEISSWIDEKEIPYIEKNSYEFKLLIRGSRDGFDVKTIYDICDKVSKTIIILKVKDTGEILGGYNPLEWDENEDHYKKTKDSFLFSLKTGNMKNSILSRAFGCHYSIIGFPSDLELRFGNALCLIGDLKTEKRCYCMKSNEYPKPIRSRWCKPCNSKHFQNDFNNWTSGNDKIDKLIQDAQLNANYRYKVIEWVPYDRFKDVKQIGKGGFGTIHYARWIDGPIREWDIENQQWKRYQDEVEVEVALKKFDNFVNFNDVLNE